MLTTTLKDIRAQSPCPDGWEELLKHLGKTGAEAKTDETPLGFDVILESNGLDDALWCLRALPESMDNECRLLACDFAEPALKYITTGDDRPAKAIAMARRFAMGHATKEELAAAGAAAWEAVRAAAEAATAAAWAAGAAARAAAWAAAWAAGDAAGAAGDAAWAAQAEIFKAWIAKF